MKEDDNQYANSSTYDIGVTTNAIGDNNSKLNTLLKRPSDIGTYTTEALNIPAWGVGDFFNDLNRWHKGLSSVGGELGYFYFKIFFDFLSPIGLLGGVFGNNKNDNKGNTALNYLKNIDSTGRYSTSNLPARIKSLTKFIKYLSWINSNAPWFFNKITGLDDASNVKYIKESNDKKIITIECMPEAIDMRLGTLIDLYRYSCFDNINFREIIPENLRTFNMQVMVMSIPIKYYNTKFSGSNNIGYKNSTTLGNNIEDFMSFKLYTFNNCEIVLDETKNILGESFQNDTFQKIELGKISIKYNRCYQQRMNEWENLFVGDYLYNEYDKNKKLSDLGKNNNYITELEQFIRYAGNKTEKNVGNLTVENTNEYEKSGYNFKYQYIAETEHGGYGQTYEDFNNPIDALSKPLYLGNLYEGSPIDRYKQNLDNIAGNVFDLKHLPNILKDMADVNSKKIINTVTSIGSQINNAIHGNDPNTSNNGMFSEYDGEYLRALDRMNNNLTPTSKNQALKGYYDKMFGSYNLNESYQGKNTEEIKSIYKDVFESIDKSNDIISSDLLENNNSFDTNTILDIIFDSLDKPDDNINVISDDNNVAYNDMKNSSNSDLQDIYYNMFNNKGLI